MSKGRHHAIDAKRRHIHKRMQRAKRLPKYMRMEQAGIISPEMDRPHEGAHQHSTEEVKPLPVEKAAPAPKEQKSFMRKIFNRKTGGS